MTAVSLGCWWPTDLLSFRNFPLQESSLLSEESAQHAFRLALLQCGTSFKANLGVKAPPQGLPRTPVADRDDTRVSVLLL